MINTKKIDFSLLHSVIPNHSSKVSKKLDFKNKDNFLPFSKNGKQFPTINKMIPSNTEKLFQENMLLKTLTNEQTKEISILKSEIMKKDSELAKLNKVLQNLFNQQLDQTKLDENTISNIKEAYLINKLKMQYRDIANSLKEKSKELMTLKKNLKSTKLNESLIENEVLKAEILNLKSKLASFGEKKIRNSSCNSEIISNNDTKETLILKQECQKLKEEIKENKKEYEICMKNTDYFKESCIKIYEMTSSFICMCKFLVLKQAENNSDFKREVMTLMNNIKLFIQSLPFSNEIRTEKILFFREDNIENKAHYISSKSNLSKFRSKCSSK